MKQVTQGQLGLQKKSARKNWLMWICHNLPKTSRQTHQQASSMILPSQILFLNRHLKSASWMAYRRWKRLLVVGIKLVSTKHEGRNALCAMEAVFAYTANKSNYAKSVVVHHCVFTTDREVSAKIVMNKYQLQLWTLLDMSQSAMSQQNSGNFSPPSQAYVQTV